jgi:hypothetical protein
MRQHRPEHDDSSLLGDSLRSVTRFASRRPKLTLWLVAVLAAAAIGLTMRDMDFKTARADLIDPNAAFHQRWVRYTESFGDASDIVVVVEATTPDLIKQVLDDLGTRMKRESDLFANVLYKIEPGRLRHKGLQFLSPEQLEAGLNRIAEYRPILQGRWDLVRVDSLYRRLRYQLESQRKAGDSERRDALLYHADLLTTSMSRYFFDSSDFLSPWPDALPVDPRLIDEANQVIYFLNDEGNLGFLKAFPAKRSDGFQNASESIGRARELISEVGASYPDAKISLTGIPVLEYDEMHRSQSDMLTASLISLVGVGFLLFVGFRGFRHPMLALLMLAVGMAWAFGYTTLTVGHLNILSVSFAVILIGLGIDFGIHYLARYLELRHEGQLLRPALIDTSVGVGTGIVTAAVTTALAFFCATLTQFLGAAELGIIAGGGILLCAVATFVVLPALIALADKNIEPRRLPTPFEGNLLRSLTSQYPLVVLLVSLAVIAGIGSRTIGFDEGRIVSRIRYDYNLLNLQADDVESVSVQRRVFQKAQDSLLFAVSVADTPQEARRLRQKFESLPSVHHVEELASYLPAFAPEETQLLVQSFRAQLARLPPAPVRLPDADPAAVGRVMEEFFLVLRDSYNPATVKLARRLDFFLDHFEKSSLPQQAAFLNSYQHRMASALFGQFRGLAAASYTAPVALADLPSALTSRFVSREGKWLVQIFPKDQIWEIEPLSRFVADVRSVDPDVTGTPLQNFEAGRQIKQSYENAALYALAVICMVLLVDSLSRKNRLPVLLSPLVVVGFVAMALHTRRIEYNPVLLVAAYAVIAGTIAAVIDFQSVRNTVLAMFAPLAGGALMLGILVLLEVDLNPANLIVLPLVLGIGVDDGVHVIHDFRMQKGRYRTSSSTINAIVLTSLTSMIGFGSMLLASHRGLYSVGWVLVVGIGCCLFVSLVTLPAILTLISRRNLRSGVESADSDPGSQQTSSKRSKKAA